MAVTNTPNLDIERIDPDQGGKEVTHNDAINKFDAYVQMSVKDRDLTAPPGGEDEGARYLIAGSPTGAWTGKAGQLAIYYQGYKYLAPHEGMRLWVDDENKFLVYNGATWQEIGSGSSTLNNFAATTNPTTGDDSGDGYGVGSMWYNVTLDRCWTCIDATAAAAIWREFVGTTDTQTLSAKTLTTPKIAEIHNPGGIVLPRLCRDFNGTSDVQYADRVASLAAPFSFHCWVYFDVLASGQYYVLWAGDKDVTGEYARLFVTVGDAMYFEHAQGADYGFASKANPSVGAWHAVAFAASASNARQIYIDNVAGTAGTQTVGAMANCDRIAIGAKWASGAASNYLDGKIAEATFWPAYALTAADVANLYRGIDPAFIAGGLRM